MKHARKNSYFLKIPYDFYERPYARLFFHVFSFIYLEILFRIWIFHTLLSIGTLFSVLFALPAGVFVFGLTSFFNYKVNRILSWVLILLYTLPYAVQVVYFSVFRTFLSLYSISGTSQVMQFWQQIFFAVLKSLVILILMLVPLVVMLLIGLKKFRFYPILWRYLPISAGALIFLHTLPLLIMLGASRITYSAYDLYYHTAAPELSMQKLGMLTTLRLDLKRLMLGFEPDTGSNEPPWSAPAAQPKTNDKTIDNQDDTSSAPATAPVYKPNIMDIDFDRLKKGEKDKTIVNMHEYFSQAQPTMQNKYTGIFKGCNLVFITAESYSHYAIDRELTPTLYKLANEGFRFNHFYNPVWGVSTSDGEYVACTGLIPKSGVWSFSRSGKNWLPFAMGNQFSTLGYLTRAYHNHTYTYYDRDISHPNMGYAYMGVGNGLEIKKSWPESDVEMIEKTTPNYSGDKKFHVYYMTVSGHLNYTFTGNYIAYKNKELVDHLPNSDAAKAYLACNIELDRALELLIQRLEAAGVAENTVIAMSADHYPYGLTNRQISELAGHEVEENFELYKSSFILWKKGMKPVTIEKPCSSLDIIPTLSNLFGLEFDSRLLMGRDILSDAPPLVIFSNRSWITDKARYNAPKNKTENLADKELPEDYVKDMNKLVNHKFRYSAYILDKDYYRVVLPPHKTDD